MGIEHLTVLFPTEVSSFDFQVECTDRTVQYKLNAQSLRLFRLQRDVNDAHRAGANRLQNKSKHDTRHTVSVSNDINISPLRLSLCHFVRPNSNRVARSQTPTCARCVASSRSQRPCGVVAGKPEHTCRNQVRLLARVVTVATFLPLSTARSQAAQLVSFYDQQDGLMPTQQGSSLKGTQPGVQECANFLLWPTFGTLDVFKEGGRAKLASHPDRAPLFAFMMWLKIPCPWEQSWHL